jgi:hypothetical protein
MYKTKHTKKSCVLYDGINTKLVILERAWRRLHESRNDRGAALNSAP